MTILIKKKHPRLPVATMPARLFLKKAMLLMGLQDKEISVFFTDDDGIQELNRIYLGKNRPTNVLAFSLLAAGTMLEGEITPKDAMVPKAEAALEAGAALMETPIGDIVISVATAQREAEQAEIACEDVIASLLLHGLLHLIGYNHEGVNEARAEQMRSKEDEIFFLIKGYRLER